jgi:hypothetical protein
MSYTITTTAGSSLATIADGTVNSTTTSLTLIGKNYAGYGIFLNENYIKLLENFNNSSAPSAPLTGQLWYDSAGTLKVWNGSSWKPISSSAAGNQSPSNPIIGDLWYDSQNVQLNVYTGSTWLPVGPAYTTTSGGTSGAVVETMYDAVPTPHVVVKFYVQSTVVAILSKDASFAPNPGLSGFTNVVPGFNLSTAIPNSVFTGTVTTAASLQGITASQFLRSDQAATTAYTLGVGGLSVGSDLAITAAGDVSYTNSTSNRDINFFVNKSGSTTKAVGIVGTTGAVTFSNAVAITGALTTTGAATMSSTTLLSGITTIGAQVLPSLNNSIEIGSTSFKFANVWATTFRGQAITAQYADLAERFEADAPMLPGTVVELGGVKEITRAIQELSETVFGVISTRAGFLMNGLAGDDVTHPPIAMQGRVPIRVVGRVDKGDRLVSAGMGLARAAKKSELTAFNVLGRALETKNTDGEGMIEAIVKLNS